VTDAPSERPSARPRVALAIVALGLLAGGAPLARRVDPAVRVAAERLPLPEGELAALRLAPAAPGAPRRTALLGHGITASKETTLRLGEALARAGYACLLIDFPGHGESSAPFEDARLRAALVAARRALVGEDGRLDVYVGHSMGAYLGERAVAEGVLRPRLFVALGARVELAAAPDRRVLLVTGALDPLASPDAVRGAAGAGAEVVVVGSEHVLEPFDRDLVAAVAGAAVETAGGDRVPPSSAWALRLAGAAACLLGGLLLVPVAAPPAGPEGTSARRALAAGVLAGLAVAGGAAVGLGGAWIDLVPRPAAWPAGLLLAGAAGALSWALAWPFRRAFGWAAGAAPAGQAAAMLVGLAAAAALAASGGRFHALLVAAAAVVVGCGAAVGAFAARRTGHPAAAHGAFAVMTAWLPTLWAPVLL